MTIISLVANFTATANLGLLPRYGIIETLSDFHDNTAVLNVPLYGLTNPALNEFITSSRIQDELRNKIPAPAGYEISSILVGMGAEVFDFNGYMDRNYTHGGVEQVNLYIEYEITTINVNNGPAPPPFTYRYKLILKDEPVVTESTYMPK